MAVAFLLLPLTGVSLDPPTAGTGIVDPATSGSDLLISFIQKHQAPASLTLGKLGFEVSVGVVAAFVTVGKVSVHGCPSPSDVGQGHGGVGGCETIQAVAAAVRHLLTNSGKRTGLAATGAGLSQSPLESSGQAVNYQVWSILKNLFAILQTELGMAF